jgi:hypothetical protein
MAKKKKARSVHKTKPTVRGLKTTKTKRTPDGTIYDEPATDQPLKIPTYRKPGTAPEPFGG